MAEHTRRLVIAVVLLAVAMPARAQEPATSLNQLRVLVRRGDTVSVIDSTGRELKGTIDTPVRIGARAARRQERANNTGIRNPYDSPTPG